jgi:hypothetical protein
MHSFITADPYSVRAVSGVGSYSERPALNTALTVGRQSTIVRQMHSHRALLLRYTGVRPMRVIASGEVVPNQSFERTVVSGLRPLPPAAQFSR